MDQDRAVLVRNRPVDPTGFADIVSLTKTCRARVTDVRVAQLGKSISTKFVERAPDAVVLLFVYNVN